MLHPFYFRFFFTKHALVRIQLQHGAHSSSQHPKGLPLSDGLPLWLINAQDQLQDYLLGISDSFSIPCLFLEQKSLLVSAWKKLSTIPRGSTWSYAEFSTQCKLGSPRYAGYVLSQNPFPLILPCHRVVRSDGTIGGFTPHIAIKSFLLNLEKNDAYG